MLLEGLGDGVVGGLLLQVLVPWSRSTLTGKDIGNPGVPVSVLPEGNADAALDVKAGLDDGGVVASLLLELFLGDGKLHPDVELGNSNIDLELIGPLLPDSLHGVVDVALNDVGLGTDTVDWDTLLLELRNKLGDGLGLGRVALKVVLKFFSNRYRLKQQINLRR